MTQYKFKVGDKVTCIAGNYKYADGIILRLGNGVQPFYSIEWSSRKGYHQPHAVSWSHENHLVPYGFSKKEVKMNETLKKMEVGKLYKNNTSDRIVKVLAISTKGEVFIEGIETDSSSILVGRGHVVDPQEFKFWDEYTEPKKLYINIYEFGVPLTNYTGCYSTVIDADKARDVGVYQYGYKFIKRIETEI